jgi:hypothetical protein
MDYRIEFDMAEAGYRYGWFPLAGVGIAAIGVIQLLWRRRHPDPRRSWWRRFEPPFTVAFGAFVAGVTFAGTYWEYRELVSALENRDYTVVEGVVHNFVPMPYEGHAHESFDVAGHHYEYSDFMVTEGFNNTQSHGGPIRDGLRVRIADVGGRIARLEIAR